MRKQMKQIIAMLLMIMVLLCGCGSSGVSQEDYDKIVTERDELLEQLSEIDKPSKNTIMNTKEEIEPFTSNESIDGFQKPEYSKFNSYASENGLGGTLIYIEGKVVTQAILEGGGMPQLGLVIEQKDGNRWCVNVRTTSKIEGIKGKNVRIFGTYEGFSDLMNLPGLSVLAKDEELQDKARIEMEENEEYKTIWNFVDHKINNPQVEENMDINQSETSLIIKEKNDKKNEEGDSEENLGMQQSVNSKETESIHIPSVGEQNALSKAKDYLEFTAFSYKGLIEQLEYEKFSHEEAVYGADNCGADWNEQAKKKAKEYSDFTSFSKDGLIEQLEYEGFTHEEAVYGAEQNGY